MTENPLISVFFALVAAAVIGDLLADAASVGAAHLAIEVAVAVGAVAGAAVFARRTLDERAEAARWRARAEQLLAGVGASITEQLVAWSLTEAEQEVAVLLLKGLSFKEIAAVRDTSERTAREQARAVYRKAGVAGRAELSAWFLEDLLAPAEG